MNNSIEKNQKEIKEVYKNHNEEEIFNHIGRKTKNFARFLAVINSMISIIIGVGTIAISAVEGFTWGILIGIAVIFIGCIISFLSSFSMYAIGEIAILTYDTNTYVKNLQEEPED